MTTEEQKQCLSELREEFQLSDVQVENMTYSELFELVRDLSNKYHTAKGTMVDVAHHLLDYDTDRDMAVRLIGEKAVVSYKLNEDYNLDCEDREYILKLMNKHVHEERLHDRFCRC